MQRTNKPWRKLIGEKCWHVSVGGATAPSFLLALGQKITRRRPLRNKAQPISYRKHRGSVELLVWCTWRLQTAERVLASSDQEEVGFAELRKLIGAEVAEASCDPPAWDLNVGFIDGRTLMVFCDHLEPEASCSQNWELWLPEFCATAGPGATFRIDESTQDV